MPDPMSPPPPELSTPSEHRRGRNRFDRMEWAGAFGDLGTFIPFVVAYLTVLKMDPVGVLWLILGLTGATGRIVRIVPRTVIVAIVLGLGLGFMLEGIRMMHTSWPIAAVGLFGTLLLLANRVLLALPQLPLTLGNAIVAVSEENNRLFRGNPVRENSVAISTGIVNVGSALCDGVPMCHGAGGMAGHVAFGARTGGAPIILGSTLLIMALLFAGSIETILAFFPRAVLGVILFLTGAPLALGSSDFSKDKGERFVNIATAAFSMWNVGLAFLVGLALSRIAKRGWLRP